MFPSCPRLRASRLLCVLIFLVSNVSSFAANETLVPLGATWRFFATGQSPEVRWSNREFDDSGWMQGAAKIGVGHSDHATFLPAPAVAPRMAVYFRKQFTLPSSPVGITGLLARIVCDAGAVIYLNGVEAARVGMPAGTVTSQTAASAEPFAPEEGSLRAVLLGSEWLVAGTNTIAVEIHASSSFDFDLDFDLELIATRNALPAFVTRGPYLQNGAPDSVTVRWRTNVATPTHARTGVSASTLDVVASYPAPVTEHEIRLTGLLPDTLYHYAIGDGAEMIEGPGGGFSFRTPPLPGIVKPVRIWVLGDCGRGRSGNNGAESVRDGYLRSPFYRQPDVWLMLGDNAYGVGSDEEYQNAVFDTYRSTLRGSILWSTLGNHETYTPGTPYFSIFTLPTLGEGGGLPSGSEHYYSFDYANIHFVCLDSMESERVPPCPMLDWLESDLANTSQRWVVAFWHHPPYSKGSHDSDFEGGLIEMRENALPILEQYGVDLVLAGHSHAYERSVLIDNHYGFSWQLSANSIKDGGSGRADEAGGAYGKDPGPHNGAVYCVAGSSGQASGGSLDHPVMTVSLSELGSLVLDIDGDRLDAKFLNPQGVIRDYFTISKAPLVIISAPQPAMAEVGGVPGIVRLSRTQGSSAPMPVALVLGGSATAGLDYGAPSLPAVIPDDQPTLDLSFSAFADILAEGTETISVTLVEGAGYRIPKSARTVTLSIADRPIDAWRLEKFGILANTPLIAGDDADPDADGQSNRMEYVAGTEPRDPSSSFAAVPARNASGQFVVRFLARKGRSYTVLQRESFSSGAWQIVATVLPPATNQFIEIPDPGAGTSAQGFYRVTTTGLP